MTSTSVVLGIATLGRPGACPGCDCAPDNTGSTAMSEGIMNFIGSPLVQAGYLSFFCKEYERTLFGQKNYSSAKHFIKRLLAFQHLLTLLRGTR
jgi:hypothetical protein